MLLPPRLSDSDQSVTSRREDDNIPPQELSGDENEEKGLVINPVRRRANLLLTSTLVAKTAFGAGIIALPYTVSKLGYVLSAFALVFFLILNQFSVTLLLKSKNLSRHSNYSTILYHLSRTNSAAIFGSFIIFIQNFGTCILLLGLLRENIQRIAKSVSNDPKICQGNILLHKIFIIVVMGMLLFPFTLVRKIQNLKVYSFIGMTGIIAFVVGVIVMWIKRKTTDQPDQIILQPFPDDLLTAVAALVNIPLAYSFQVNFFPIFKGLKNPTDQRMKQASLLGLIQCCIPYAIVGYLGFFLLDDPDDINFLNSIKYRNEIMEKLIYFAMHSSFFLSSFMSIVLYFFGLRNNFINIINILRKRTIAIHLSQQSQFDEDARQGMLRKINKQYILFTSLLMVIMIILAILSPDIKIVYNLLGAVSEAIFSLILPYIFYVLLVRRQDQPRNSSYYISIWLLAVIIPFSIFSTISNFIVQSDKQTSDECNYYQL